MPFLRIFVLESSLKFDRVCAKSCNFVIAFIFWRQKCVSVQMKIKKNKIKATVARFSGFVSVDKILVKLIVDVAGSYIFIGQVVSSDILFSTFMCFVKHICILA